MTALRRAKTVSLALLVLIDVVVCYLWLAPLHLFGLADEPNGHQMISAYVGRGAINGHRWAIRAARFIDWLFAWHEPDHCRATARLYAGFAD